MTDINVILRYITKYRDLKEKYAIAFLEEIQDWKIKILQKYTLVEDWWQ